MLISQSGLKTNIRAGAIKLLKVKIGKWLCDLGLANDNFRYDTKAQATKAKINKWKYSKLKSFCTTK